MTSRLPYARPCIPFALAMVFTVIVGVGDARGDDVNIRGLWYSNVTIQKFVDGKVYFKTSAGNVVAAELRDLRTLKLNDVPAIEYAEDAFDLKQYKSAIKHYRAARSKARADWLRQWIDYRLVQSAEQTRDGLTAMTAYLSLAQSNADAYLMRHLPNRSLEKLSEPQQQQMLSKIKSAAKKIRNRSARKHLVLLQKQIEAMSAADSGPNDNDKETKSANVLLVGLLNEPRYQGNEIVKLLRKGEFPRALKTIDARLKSRDTRDRALNLYLRGVAQMKLGDAAMDMMQKQKFYKDAGISFMQVTILYPRSPWVGHCQLEAGYIHQQIGRKDLVRRLYRTARPYIEPDDDPQLDKRLDRLINELNQQRSHRENGGAA